MGFIGWAKPIPGYFSLPIKSFLQSLHGCFALDILSGSNRQIQKRRKIVSYFSILQRVLLPPAENGTFTDMSEGLGLVTELSYRLKINKYKYIWCKGKRKASFFGVCSTQTNVRIIYFCFCYTIYKQIVFV